MKLWHYELIGYLPKPILIQQYRDICTIAKLIAVYKTPNDPYVNKVTAYPEWMFSRYVLLTEKEMCNRNIKIHNATRWRLLDNIKYSKSNGYFNDDLEEAFPYNTAAPLFPDWHNDRYLVQNYHSISEMYDCGVVNEKEFNQLEKEIGYLTLFF